MIRKRPQQLKNLIGEEPITLVTKDAWYDYMKKVKIILDSIGKHVKIDQVHMKEGKIIFFDGRHDIVLRFEKVPKAGNKGLFTKGIIMDTYLRKE